MAKVGAWRTVLFLITLGAFVSLPGAATGADSLGSADVPDALSSSPASASPEPRGLAVAEEVQAVREAFGVSATQAESNVAIQGRATRVNIVGQIEAQLGDSYAGLWFDNRAGEFVVPIAAAMAKSPFLAQDRTSAVAREFATAALEDDYRVQPVEFSHTELAAGQAELDELLNGNFAGGAIRTAIDPTRNAVIVILSETADPDAVAAIRKLANRISVRVELDQRPPDAFEMEASMCANANSCDPPFRGGQQIWPTLTSDPNSEVLLTCTAAFRGNGLDGKKYVITAGHCVKNAITGNVHWWWMASGPSTVGRRSLGTTNQWHWPGKDWAKIDATGTYWDAPPWPTILGLFGSTGVNEYPITGEARSWVGQTLCHTGANTAYSCGQVIAENVSAEYGWSGKENVNGMFEVTGPQLCVGAGDSGGPFFANNIALGILSGGRPDGCPGPVWILFSDIMGANAELNVNIAGPGAPEAITGAPYEPPLPPNNERSVSGQVNPRGLATTYQIEYGVGGYQSITAPVSAGSGQGFVSVSQNLTGLQPGTVYQYRIKATNSLNSAYGAAGTFKTGTMPTVNGNLPTQNITGKQATIRASINPNNAPTTWWFEWGPTEKMGKETALSVVGGLGPNEVQQTLMGLSSGTKYWYRVIVSNSGGLRTGPTGSFTTALPGWLSRFGGTGTEPGYFKAPIALASDAAGNVYVADRNNNRIQKFTEAGNFVMQFGVKGSAPGQITQPQAVAVDQQGDIWVAETSYQRIQEFSSSGAFIREIGPNEGVNRPSSQSNMNLTIADNGEVYLAQNEWVYHYRSTPNSEGKYFLGKASTGSLFIPKTIVKDPTNGQLYLLSSEGPRAIFNLGTGAVPTLTKVCDVPWTSTPEIKSPQAFAIDSDGYGLVSSSGTNQVVKINLTGTVCNPISGFGEKGVGPGQFISPTSLALTPSGILFVGDGSHSTAPGPGITRWIS